MAAALFLLSEGRNLKPTLTTAMQSAKDLVNIPQAIYEYEQVEHPDAAGLEDLESMAQMMGAMSGAAAPSADNMRQQLLETFYPRINEVVYLYGDKRAEKKTKTTGGLLFKSSTLTDRGKWDIEDEILSISFDFLQSTVEYEPLPDSPPELVESFQEMHQDSKRLMSAFNQQDSISRTDIFNVLDNGDLYKDQKIYRKR